MRYIFAAFLVWALGASTAFALPMASANSPSIQKADPVVQVAKKGKPQPRRQKSGAASGIHPLVGSGGY
jgi:hypothetical protein